MSTFARHTSGTYRLCSPEETLARVAPHRLACGITRVTSVTGLDTLGVPTYCAVRPDALTLQVCQGKGLTPAAAEASAVMEALEVYHAEHPLPERLEWTCRRDLERAGRCFVAPEHLHGFRPATGGPDFRCEWVQGRNLADGRPVLAPASAVYFQRRPALHYTTLNGLASGNHLAEACLHGLYELIERDAMSRLVEDGRLRIRKHGRVVDTSTIDRPELRAIVDKAGADQTRVVLIWLPSVVPVHTFWSVFVNTGSLAPSTRLNVGWGTHAAPHIAAARALTEAAQSRASFIHGAREDFQEKPVLQLPSGPPLSSPAYRFFAGLEPDTDWRDLVDTPCLPADTDLERALDALTAALARAGHTMQACVELTRPEIGIPVVKLLVPGLRFNHKLF